MSEEGINGIGNTLSASTRESLRLLTKIADFHSAPLARSGLIDISSCGTKCMAWRPIIQINNISNTDKFLAEFGLFNVLRQNLN